MLDYELTGVPFRDELLALTACSISVSYQSVKKFADTSALMQKLRRSISIMLEDRYFASSPFENAHALRLGKEGLRVLHAKAPELYDYYMKYSAGNRPASSPKHYKTHYNIANSTWLLSRCDVLVGPQKKSIIEIENGAQKIASDQSIFLTTKEQISASEQNVRRGQFSHSTGILYSPGFVGNVYCLQAGDNARQNASHEYEMNLQVPVIGSRIFDDQRVRKAESALIIGDSFLQLENLCVSPEIKADARRVHESWADILSGKCEMLSSIRYHFVPFGPEAVNTVKLLTNFTEEEIRYAVFPSDVRENAKAMGIGEGVVNDRIFYQFLTADVTKMLALKRSQILNVRQIEIICQDYQVDYLERLFEGQNVLIRPIASFDEFFAKAKEIRDGVRGK